MTYISRTAQIEAAFKRLPVGLQRLILRAIAYAKKGCLRPEDWRGIDIAYLDSLGRYARAKSPLKPRTYKPRKRKTKPRRCPGCGVRTPDLIWAADPYASEINHNETPVWLCRACRVDSAADV